MQSGEIIRDWVLEEPLGAGGVGEVWKARHRILHDKVIAIKAIYTDLDQAPSFNDRFLQEAVNMASLKHPHIVAVHDFFFEYDRAFLTMSYIEGESLQDIIDRRAPLSIDETLKIAVQVLDALDYAHDKTLIHRDVKPSNILIRDDGQAFLVDFGIALRLGQERKTRFGTNVGTPEYMSPEQIRGGAMDRRADIYSFGCVLYEMLTGQPPFGSQDEAGKSEFEIMNGHINEDVIPPKRLNTDIEPIVETAILTALQKNPEDRFKDCRQMSEALAVVRTDIRRHRPEGSYWGAPVNIGFLQKYAQFDGRAGRKEYWFFVLLNAAVCAFLALVGYFIDPAGAAYLPIFYLIPVLIPTIAATVRRLHDTGRSGNWILVNFMPVVGQIVMLLLLVQDGEPRSNLFGPDPKAP